jgi:hypothetical protein
VRKNEVLVVITDELDEAGIAYVVEPGGKHLKIWFVVGGRRRMQVCSLSSSRS